MFNSEFDNRYATMWIIHYLTLTQNEGGITYIENIPFKDGILGNI
jgi:hypothetical protein